MLNHVNRKWEGDPNIIKTKVIAGYEFKLIAHNAVRFENGVALQKLNSSYNLTSK